MIKIGTTLLHASALMRSHPGTRKSQYVCWFLRKEGFFHLYTIAVTYDNSGRYGSRHLCITFTRYRKTDRISNSESIFISVSGSNRNARIAMPKGAAANWLQLQWTIWLRNRAERIANEEPRPSFWARFFPHHDSNIQA